MSSSGEVAKAEQNAAVPKSTVQHPTRALAAEAVGQVAIEQGRVGRSPSAGTALKKVEAIAENLAGFLQRL
jgi:hypothetical protein